VNSLSKRLIERRAAAIAQVILPGVATVGKPGQCSGVPAMRFCYSCRLPGTSREQWV